jgi:RNA polymerase sigma-70 factor (ECF subfamily)
VLRYRQPVLRLAYRLVGSRAEALEITQEAFLATYQKLPDWNPRAKFYTWLYRVTVNLSITRLRRRARRKTAEMELARMHKVHKRSRGGSDGSAALVRLHSAMRTLSEKQRTVLVLHFYEGLSSADTAQILGITPNNVRVTLHGALEKLRGLLAPAHA